MKSIRRLLQTAITISCLEEVNLSSQTWFTSCCPPDKHACLKTSLGKPYVASLRDGKFFLLLAVAHFLLASQLGNGEPDLA
ncbi:hypothetical protein SLA2020_266580 [Shorea laevis]